MTERIINTPEELDLWFTFLLSRKLPITVSSTDGRDRTGQQNRLQFLWAREASDQRGDMTPEEVRCEWKLIYGVPILREESPDFRELYDGSIRPLPYERKLKAMRFIPVSSEMSVPQMIRYLDTIQRECAEQGILLTEPDPELAKYQSRYRESGRKAA